ncbi:aspartyl aminopeptidase [Malassezia cuniculi]|uniref:aspartyl aminopeptidase n=1 Tax=Malassezia cuniculi TaxID=948313 RepID=A0AAF0ENG2_9BASI|nr:aspartyl aminopeptidase [Malassezia cuniculi]
MAGPICPAALRFIKYVDASPTPFHAVASSVARLEAAGFTKLHEQKDWRGSVRRGGNFTRNQSSLVAFAVGESFVPGNGVHIVGGHTDSPNLRVRPVSKRSKEGYLQCAVETYGGGLWATWFDRDLGIAGRVIVAVDEKQTQFESRLVRISRPIARVPNLAIHLNRSANDAFKFNQEEQLLPILGLADSLNRPADNSRLAERHHPVLLDLLASELDVSVDQIRDFELMLFDTQAPAVGGASNEFIFSPRVDNQMTCFCATEGLVNSLENSSLASSDAVRAIALFDNEEVGSVSNQGAESNIIWSLLQRLSSLSAEDMTDPGMGVPQSAAPSAALEQSLAASFLISSDTAHAVHPNYANIYADGLRPKINAGPVIKTNAKQRYASTAATTFLLRRVAERAGVPLQEFEVRNDCTCGSTIGPMLSKVVRTVDIGNPQLSMHSIRETCGSRDVKSKIDLVRIY